jgi:hypothetical protein
MQILKWSMINITFIHQENIMIFSSKKQHGYEKLRPVKANE